jgi:hypothetical protein
LEWFKQLLAKALAVLDREVWVLRDVGDAIKVADLAVQEVSHEE